MSSSTPTPWANEPCRRRSTVNFEPGSDVANTAFVALSPEGRICYRTSQGPGPRVLLDVTGFTMPGSGIELQDPVRLLDTRTSAPVAPGAVQTVQVTGRAGVPAGAAAVIVNVTATQVASAGNLRVFPAGRPVPERVRRQLHAGKGQGERDDRAAVVVGEAVVRLRHGRCDRARDPRRGRLRHRRGRLPGADADAACSTPAPGPGASARWRVRSSRARRTPCRCRARWCRTGATSVVLNVTAIGPSSLGNLRVYPSRVPRGPRGVDDQLHRWARHPQPRRCRPPEERSGGGDPVLGHGGRGHGPRRRGRGRVRGRSLSVAGRVSRSVAPSRPGCPSGGRTPMRSWSRHSRALRSCSAEPLGDPVEERVGHPPRDARPRRRHPHHLVVPVVVRVVDVLDDCLARSAARACTGRDA